MRRFLIVIAGFVLIMPLHAQTTFTLQEENDSFARASLRSDRAYTNGTRMLWSWVPSGHSRLDRVAAILCGHTTEQCDRTVTAGLGQNMYTPENLARTSPVLGDRPYGGWLYGTLMFDATRQRTNDHIELYAGVIGRDSHAEEVQTFVHQHVTPRAQDPLGWDNQIGEWAAFLASYERRVKLLPRKLRNDRLSWFDVTPAIGGAAGNVFINASASTTVRLGYNLPPYFIEPIRAVPFALRTNTREKPETRPDWDAYIYVVANATYVARNVFIDAEDEQYRIERRSSVREHRAGISVRVRHFRFAYQQTWRSSEFRPLVTRVQQSSRAHSYGMIMISIGPNP
jgi:lipid A 3-O-deacylase